MSSMKEKYMEYAIEKAWIGVNKGQEPFGSCVVKDGKVLSVSHNTVRMDNDPTAHAEMNAIREACSSIGSPDLEGSVIYATFKPCEMCMEAITRAGITEVFYGASPKDVNYPSRNEKIIVKSGLLKDHCLELAAKKYPLK